MVTLWLLPHVRGNFKGTRINSYDNFVGNPDLQMRRRSCYPL